RSRGRFIIGLDFVEPFLKLKALPLNDARGYKSNCVHSLDHAHGCGYRNNGSRRVDENEPCAFSDAECLFLELLPSWLVNHFIVDDGLLNFLLKAEGGVPDLEYPLPPRFPLLEDVIAVDPHHCRHELKASRVGVQLRPQGI